MTEKFVQKPQNFNLNVTKITCFLYLERVLFKNESGTHRPIPFAL